MASPAARKRICPVLMGLYSSLGVKIRLISGHTALCDSWKVGKLCPLTGYKISQTLEDSTISFERYSETQS